MQQHLQYILIYFSFTNIFKLSVQYLSSCY
jgi:hypothetical protein